MKFNIKSNEVFSDFKLLPCFESIEVHHIYVAWRKAVRTLWRLPYTTHCNLLHTINNSLTFEISLEKS